MITLSPTETGWYIFGLTHLTSALPVLTGFGQAPLEIVAQRGQVGAVGCAVSLDEFGQEALAQHLKDMDWLSQTAATHYAYCEQLFRPNQSFLPFRFCTVFSSPVKVAELLETRQAEIENELNRLNGKAEFSLKIWGRQEWLSSLALASDPALRQLYTDANSPGGKAFFARKQLEISLAERRKQIIPTLTLKLTGLICNGLELDKITSCKPLKLPEDQLEGYTPLAKLALLLDENQAARLTSLVERLDREALRGGQIEITGPLPVYSFIRLGNDEVQ